MCGEKKRSLRAVRATSKTRHTLQEEYEILIKVVHLRIGFLKLQWWELHCSQHCHLTSGLPTTLRRANSHFLSKWNRIRYFVFAPSEVQQWKSIDFKYPYRSWFPSVEPKLCFFFRCRFILMILLVSPLFSSLQLTALSTLWASYCPCRSLSSASSQSGRVSTWLLLVSHTLCTCSMTDPLFSLEQQVSLYKAQAIWWWSQQYLEDTAALYSKFMTHS